MAIILERHELRLDESDKNDRLIVSMLNDMKDGVNKRLDTLENRVNDLATFRWISVGIGTAAVIIIGSASFFGNILTVGNNGATIGGGTPAQTK